MDMGAGFVEGGIIEGARVEVLFTGKTIGAVAHGRAAGRAELPRDAGGRGEGGGGDACPGPCAIGHAEEGGKGRPGRAAATVSVAVHLPKRRGIAAIGDGTAKAAPGIGWDHAMSLIPGAGRAKPNLGFRDCRGAARMGRGPGGGRGGPPRDADQRPSAVATSSMIRAWIAARSDPAGSSQIGSSPTSASIAGASGVQRPRKEKCQAGSITL